MLTEEELERYSRQIIYDGFGEAGQRRLKECRAVVAGVGGLGCAASTYLACAGVGHITLIDHERVELSNLNRQILHWDEDIGQKKVTSAAKKLARLNPAIEVTPLDIEITADNASDMIRGSNVVIDGMDNFETRSILNQACVVERIPFIHGGIWGLNGQVTTIIPGKTPCFACIYPQKPKELKPFPVFGVTPALVAIIQVAEAIKLLAGLGRTLAGKMLYINEATMDFSYRDLPKNPHCRVCGVKEGQSG
jgi:molybdopterin/thiamine biosynthesis adenylyltransferase